MSIKELSNPFGDGYSADINLKFSVTRGRKIA